MSKSFSVSVFSDDSYSILSNSWSRFFAGDKFFDERFPANKRLFSDKNYSKERLSSAPISDSVLRAVADTMQVLELSDKQKKNLELLHSASVVVSGQQVGFLGGPLYTLLKAYTAISLAEKLSAKFGRPCVPILWVEDNDHDVDEAALAIIPDNGSEIVSIMAPRSNSEKQSVSELRFTEEISEIIAHLNAVLPTTEHLPELMQTLEEIYVPNAQWSHAYMKLMQYLLGETGLLMVQSTKLRKEGCFSDIIQQELTNPGISLAALEQGTRIVTEAGYPQQISGTDYNVFFHDEFGLRSKVVNNGDGTLQMGKHHIRHEELLPFFFEHRCDFSPSVTLRSVAQDAMFPNLAYVAGPGELAYLSQLAEVYSAFGVTPAAVAGRLSCTVIFPEQMRQVQKMQKPIEFFMRSRHDVEGDIREEMRDMKLDAAAEEASIASMEILTSLTEYAVLVDGSLSGAAAALKKNVGDAITGFHKKAAAAFRRRNAEEMQRGLKLNTALFPKDALQERVVSPVYLVARLGRRGLLSLLNALAEKEQAAHCLVVING